MWKADERCVCRRGSELGKQSNEKENDAAWMAVSGCEKGNLCGNCGFHFGKPKMRSWLSNLIKTMGSRRPITNNTDGSEESSVSDDVLNLFQSVDFLEFVHDDFHVVAVVNAQVYLSVEDAFIARKRNFAHVDVELV